MSSSDLDIDLFTFVIFEIKSSLTSDGQRSEKFFRKDYHYLDGPKSFYKIHKTYENWIDAKNLCKLEGASLFYPENESETDAVIEFWNRTESHNNFDWIYVGISSRFAKNTFTTTEGRSIYDFQMQWAAWEPNNSTGFDDCTVFSKSRKTIYDDICTKTLPFICKKTLASLDWNERCSGPDNGFIYNDTLDKCYKFHGTPMSWRDAYAVCYHEQSYLAIADSQDEADFFTTFIEEGGTILEYSLAISDSYDEALWLGFQNIYGEGWITVKDTPVKVLGDDRKDTWLRRLNIRDCGYISKDGSLGLMYCTLARPFICELDTTSLNNRYV
ncbi:hypothetical protein K1T71_009827 [Dendrolimus kikuchii]|uniref:Uncharacterized protein n=1 Tax=Dendrolimus kikuchii TaxID=765133 RepID=A0ACC1CSQ4_9NEOP|nr:hypothetical protein K1T71_009827 [Dendrolimus kikuchii]